jgi:PAS domain S-box-containing protein
MHYTGMSAMLMQCSLSYDLLWFVASIVIAVGAAISALWLAFRTQDVWQRLGAAVLMGAAVSGMHYTGMAAAIFSPTTPAVADVGHAGAAHIQLALSVAALTFVILFIALMASVMDRQLVREREDGLARLYRETPLPLHSVGIDGKLQKVSNAWITLLGYSREEVIEHEITEFMTVESAINYKSNTLPALARGEQVHDVEFQFVRKTGEVLDVLLSAKLIGKPPVTVGGLVDVTARKRAEDALRQAQRMEAIGQITGGVAHDFNNLLMVISGSAERLRKSAHDQSIERPLEMISTAVKRAQSLTSHLLSFSRRQTLDVHVVDLDAALPRIADTLKRSLRGDIQVLVEAESAPCNVKIDPAEFELALLNLGVNARDAMPNGGTITLSLRRVQLDGEAEYDGLRGAFHLIEMKDTGIGIPPDVLSRIFEPFFTTKGVGKGTGLGLSQVYGFAKQSGGTTTVRSRPGRGATIGLYLPASEEEVSAAPARSEPSASGGTAHGRVLLVEDTAEVAAIVAQELTELGYTVVTAHDGTEALNKLQEGRPYDLLLSDILMPGAIGGLELAHLVRERMPNLPILLSTGYSDKAQQAIGEGFVILRKPYGLPELQSAISGLLNANDLRPQSLAAAE